MTDSLSSLLFHLAVAASAFLYSAVGHGGASAYLAILSFAGATRTNAAMTALMLNILISGTSLFFFSQARYLQWRLLWPFLIGSVPLAILGSMFKISPGLHNGLLASALTFAAYRLWNHGSAQHQKMSTRSHSEILRREPRFATASRGEDKFSAASLNQGRKENLSKPQAAEANRIPAGNFWMTSDSIPLAAALAIGAIIGFISGAIGIGGGVFLSPILILSGWAHAKETAAASAGFIFINSITALSTRFVSGATIILPETSLMFCAFAAGIVGSWTGAQQWNASILRRALSIVLTLATFKLVQGII